MPRAKKNRQRFNFPADEQPSTLTDAEIDAQIDSGESSVSLNTQRKKNQAKKEAADLVKQIPEIFTPEQVAWVFDVYVVLICFVFSILLKCEFKILHDELKLDDDVKLLWAKPLAKVVSKYAPAEWAGMTAEIELIACVGLWTATAFARARQTVEKEKEKKEAEKREQARQPRNSSVTAMPPTERAAMPV